MSSLSAVLSRVDIRTELGRAYVEYEEVSIFTMIKSIMNGKAVYPTLGNHDSMSRRLTLVYLTD